MKLFYRYVLKIFIKYLMLVEMVIVFASLMIDAMEEYMPDAAVIHLIVLEMINIPNKIIYMLPVSIMVAAIVTVMVLQRSHELLAYICVGGRITKFLIPFIVVGSVATVTMVAYDYKIYPQIKVIYNRYSVEKIAKRTYYNTGQLIDLWILDDHRLLHAYVVDPLGKVINSITEYSIDTNFQVSNIRTITKASFNDGSWLLKSISDVDISSIPPEKKFTDELRVNSELLNDLVKMNSNSPKVLTQSELFKIIRVMKSYGLNPTKYQMVLYDKYSSALSILVLLITVVPIGIDFSRKYSMTKSALVSLCGGVLFWSVWGAFRSLGASGIIPPLVANFLPHIVFVIGGLMVFAMRERAR